MTPPRPRLSAWPLLALPSAAAVALVAASIGFAQDEKPRTDAPQAASRIVSDAKPITPPARRTEVAENVREICYSVRVIDTPTSWRARYESRLTPRPFDGLQVWHLDEEMQTALLKHIMSDPKSTIFQVPKVTTFESDRATIVIGPGAEGVLGPPLNLKPQRGRDDSGSPELERGIRFDIAGRFTPLGVESTIKMLEAGFIAYKRSDDGEPDASDRAKTYYDRYKYRSSVTSDVPEHSSILIRMLGTVREVEGKTFERLALITPLRIELKPEKPAAEAVSPR
jgi:hypothetical protein